MSLFGRFKDKLKKGNEAKQNNKKNKGDVVCLKYEIRSEFAEVPSVNPPKVIMGSKEVVELRKRRNLERRQLSASFLQSRNSANNVQKPNSLTVATSFDFNISSTNNTSAVFETIVEKETKIENGRKKEQITLEKKETKFLDSRKVEEKSEKIQFSSEPLPKSLPSSTTVFETKIEDNKETIKIEEISSEPPPLPKSLPPSTIEKHNDYYVEEIEEEENIVANEQNLNNVAEVYSEEYEIPEQIRVYEDSRLFKVNSKYSDDIWEPTQIVQLEDQEEEVQMEVENQTYGALNYEDHKEEAFKVNFVQHSYHTEDEDEEEEEEEEDEKSIASIDVYTSKGYSSAAASIFFDDDDDAAYQPQYVRPRRVALDNVSNASSVSA